MKDIDELDPAHIVRTCSQKHVQSVIEDLVEEVRTQRAELDRWHTELSAVMPADFKDWTSIPERPQLAAWVIKNLRERLAETDGVAVAALRAQEPAARRYAYSIDGGETYHGAEPTPEDALGAAHDELATEHEAGTTHRVRVARLAPGVEILRGQTTALEFVAKEACAHLEGVLYDGIGGDEQLIDELAPDQRQHIGLAILELIAATGAIKGQGLADDTVHTVTLEA